MTTIPWVQRNVVCMLTVNEEWSGFETCHKHYSIFRIYLFVFSYKRILIRQPTRTERGLPRPGRQLAFVGTRRRHRPAYGLSAGKYGNLGRSSHRYRQFDPRELRYCAHGS